MLKVSTVPRASFLKCLASGLCECSAGKSKLTCKGSASAFWVSYKKLPGISQIFASQNLQRLCDPLQVFTGKDRSCEGVTCECWQVNVLEIGPRVALQNKTLHCVTAILIKRIYLFFFQDEKIVDHYMQHLKWLEFKRTEDTGFPPARWVTPRSGSRRSIAEWKPWVLGLALHAGTRGPAVGQSRDFKKNYVGFPPAWWVIGTRAVGFPCFCKNDSKASKFYEYNRPFQSGYFQFQSVFSCSNLVISSSNLIISSSNLVIPSSNLVISSSNPVISSSNLVFPVPIQLFPVPIQLFPVPICFFQFQSGYFQLQSGYFQLQSGYFQFQSGYFQFQSGYFPVLAVLSNYCGETKCFGILFALRGGVETSPFAFWVLPLSQLENKNLGRIIYNSQRKKDLVRDRKSQTSWNLSMGSIANFTPKSPSWATLSWQDDALKDTQEQTLTPGTFRPAPKPLVR